MKQGPGESKPAPWVQVQNMSLLQVMEFRGPGRFWAAGFRTSVWCRVCSPTTTTSRPCSPAQTLSVEPFPHEPLASVAGAVQHRSWRAGASEWCSCLRSTQHPAINHVPAWLAYNKTTQLVRSLFLCHSPSETHPSCPLFSASHISGVMDFMATSSGDREL